MKLIQSSCKDATKLANLMEVNEKLKNLNNQQKIENEELKNFVYIERSR